MNTLEKTAFVSLFVMSFWAVLAYFAGDANSTFLILMLSQIYLVCVLILSMNHVESEIASVKDYQSFEHTKILDIQNALNVQTGKLMLTNQALSRMDDHLRYASKNIINSADDLRYIRDLIDAELKAQEEVQEVYGPIYRPDLQREESQ